MLLIIMNFNALIAVNMCGISSLLRLFMLLLYFFSLTLFSTVVVNKGDQIFQRRWRLRYCRTDYTDSRTI